MTWSASSPPYLTSHTEPTSKTTSDGGTCITMYYEMNSLLLLQSIITCFVAYLENSNKGVGIAQWLEHRLVRKVACLNPCRSSRRIFLSMVTFCTDLCKRPWSYCQKCGWQVTAKHAYTSHTRLCMKWYGVHRTSRDGSSFMLIVRNALYKAIHSCRITCKRSELAQEWRIALHKSDQQQTSRKPFHLQKTCVEEVICSHGTDGGQTENRKLVNGSWY